MIPDFQSTMLPLLKSLSDNKIKSPKELRDHIINAFNISDEEQKVKTPNGKQLLFYNRIAWAIAYLKMAELISTPERSKYQISELGKSVLVNPPEKITIRFLKTMPNFNINRNPSKEKHAAEDDEEVIDKTPDELIAIGISQINNELSNLLSSHIEKCSAYYFEQIVLDLLLKMGYGGSDVDSGEVTSKSGDEGIDGIIKEDKLGLDKIYIQAKKWGNTVGRPEIQKFVGALHGKRAKKGIFITTSNFSREAIEYANNLDVTIILIDGNKLTNLMIENDIGVSVKENIKIRKIDSDYFIEE
jgi:restriction system protein